MGRGLGIAWYRTRATLGARLGGLVAIVVLIGLTGGVAMGAVAAARRTQSSYPRFLADSNPSDLNISAFSGDNSGNAVASQARGIAAVPGVRRVRSVYVVPYAPLTAGGAPAPASAYVFALASADGEFVTQDRAAVVHGRRADPARVDEVDVTPSAARQLHVHVGSSLSLGLHVGDSIRRRVNARVVGIVELNNQVIEDDIDAAFGFVLMTPAAYREAVRVSAPQPLPPTTYALQLDHGARDVGAVEQAFLAVVPKGSQYEFHATAPVVTQDEAAIRPESIALGVFGLIAGLVTLVVAGQAVSRQLRGGESDGDVLRALGAGPAAIALDGLLGVAAAIIAGALLAVALAVALSPIAPLGPVRAVYPGRGLTFDWTVLAIGVVVLVFGLGALAIAIAWRRAPHRRARARRGTSRPRMSGSAARAAVPAPAAVGIQFALERDRAPGAAPVRAASLGTVVAVAFVVATLVFSSSLHTLVSHPRLYGWNWTYAIVPSNEVPPRTLTLLQRDHEVEGWTGVSYVLADVGGVVTPVIFSHPNARVAPPTLSGHGLEADDEIVIGATTLARLHKHVGDTVVFSYAAPTNAPAYVPPTRLKIVGTATLPAVGFTSIVADHTSMGTGAILSYGVQPAAMRRAIATGDPNTVGPDLVFVRMRSDVTTAQARANLQPIIAATDKTLAADKNTIGQDISLMGVQRPAQIVNYRTIGAAPLVLAAGLAVGAIVALALTLTASVRRRRRDLALLKTLGFTRRQLAATVAAQATVAALIGVVIGIPLGVIAGRWLWTAFAREIAAVPSPTVPVTWILAVALATLVLANLVGAVPSRQAARTPSAVLLHTE